MYKMDKPIDKSSTTYKDTLLRTLYNDEQRALELCNALTRMNYPSNSKVTILNLDNSLVRRYNDLAIAVENQLLIMIEHQSSINPNLPLRLLSYITDTLYSWFVDMEKIYGSKLLKLPTPKFYVLYNGAEKLNYDTLRLSDSFRINDNEVINEPSLELIVEILNVNYGSDCYALKNSPTLNGYAYLIDQINIFLSQKMIRDKAIKLAINKCIEENVLSEFLKENYERVANMLYMEYDKDVEMRVIRNEGIEEGEIKGRLEEKFSIALRLINKGEPIDEIIDITGLSHEEIQGLKTHNTVLA